MIKVKTSQRTKPQKKGRISLEANYVGKKSVKVKAAQGVWLKKDPDETTKGAIKGECQD